MTNRAMYMYREERTPTARTIARWSDLVVRLTRSELSLSPHRRDSSTSRAIGSRASASREFRLAFEGSRAFVARLISHRGRLSLSLFFSRGRNWIYSDVCSDTRAFCLPFAARRDRDRARARTHPLAIFYPSSSLAERRGRDGEPVRT